jgi:hypothetical protein
MKINLSTFKNRLYAIACASLFVRAIAFFALPTTPSSLGPDEGTYGQLAEWTALGKPADDFPVFGAGLYRSSRAFILPAAMFSRLGLNELDAVRLTATLYGFLTVLIVIGTLLKSISESARVANFIADNQKIFILLFSVYVFLPSHLVWSLLGLRESATEFWVVASIVIVHRILNFQIRFWSVAISLLSIAIISVISSRPQVGWVLGFSLLIYFLARIRVKAAQVLAPVTLIAVFLGYLATSAFAIESTDSFTARAVITDPSPINSSVATTSPTIKESSKPLKSPSTTSQPEETPSPEATSQAEFVASKVCTEEGQILLVEGVSYNCTNRSTKRSSVGVKSLGDSVLEQVDEISGKHKLNQVGAASVIRTIACPVSENTRFDKYFCMAYRAPYTTSVFLFRPMLGVDVTSSSSLFAALENIFWLGAALFVVVMFIRNRRLAFFGALAPSLLFFSLYSVAAGSYEGNMGTAFRHKSLILWVVILLVASTIVATQQRKTELEGISGSSQE